MKKIALLLLIFSCSSVSGQYYRLGEKFVSQAILLELVNKGGTGSAVVVQIDSSIILVTAKHVLVEDLVDPATQKRKMRFRDDEVIGSFYPGDPYASDRYSFSIDLLKARDNKAFAIHQEKDMIILVLGRTEGNSLILHDWVKGVNTSKETVLTIVFEKDFCKLSDLRGGDESFIIGYPKSLDLTEPTQFDFERPLIGKGIISGKDHRNGTFVVNTPAFPGNSGGPIFVLMDNEVKLAGIVVEYIPYIAPVPIDSLGNRYDGVINSGYSVVIPIEIIYSLVR